MSYMTKISRTLVVGAGIATALSLTGCGGAAKPSGQTTSLASSTSASQTTQSTTTSQSTAGTGSVTPLKHPEASHKARAYYNWCLRANGVNIHASALSARDKHVGAVCFKAAEARYQAGVRAEAHRRR